jgi:glycosyltransferase involved in cell wall biosynthesis
MSTPVGEPGGEELARLSRLGSIPRRDYVQLAQELDAEVLDAEFMLTRASRAGQLVARRAGVVKGLLFEAYTQSHRYVHLVAWADRLGLPLALLNKLSGRRRDLAMLSAYASQGRKAQLLKDAKVHTHLGALMYYSGEQRRLAVERLGVPENKTFYLGNPVDERFWAPLDRPVEDTVVAVGWEARDYPTLLSAMAQAPCTVDVAVGTLGLWGSAANLSSEQQGPDSDDARRAFLEACRGTLSYPIYRAWIDTLDNGTLGSHVRVHHQLSPQQLRELYARARVVVVPLHDVEFDAGVTAICEGMAMGKPVVVTRTRGQVDVLRDGEQGLYVPPGDPRALREAVQYLLDNPARAEQMGRAGRALVVERHTVDAFVSRAADIVRSTPSPLVPASARAGGP